MDWIKITAVAVSVVAVLALAIRLLRAAGARGESPGDADGEPAAGGIEWHDDGSVGAFARPGRCPECGRPVAKHEPDCPNA